MKANVTISTTQAAIKDAVETFTALEVHLTEKWYQTILRIAREQLAKAWFPWTKRYWQERLGFTSEELIRSNGTYYNSPQYLYWSQRRKEKAETMLQKYVTAKNVCAAHQIILDDEELAVLVDVTTAKEMLETRH